MKRPLILSLGERQRELANTMANVVDGDVSTFAERSGDGDNLTFDSVPEAIRYAFDQERPLICVMSVGIIVRCLPSVLPPKAATPPVIAVAEDGSFAVPVLGGHQGANHLASMIAVALSGTAAITTAGEVQLGVALDEPPPGYHLRDGDAKAAMAAILNGASVSVSPRLPWAAHLATTGTSDAITVELAASDDSSSERDAIRLRYVVERFVLGVGCERGADGSELLELANEVLHEGRIEPSAVAAVVSIDLKADEQAVHELSTALDRPARFLFKEELQKVEDRLITPSRVVRDEVGVAGVAEAAALSASGSDGALVVPKRKSKRCTASLAKSPTRIDPFKIGTSRGRLTLVGLGPGREDWRSPEASSAIRNAEHVVGYTLYLDLCAELIRGERHDFALGEEEVRVRHAIQLAGRGTDVALVCSGDPGIYAMAALTFEVLDRGGCSDREQRIAVEVVPGISALQGAAARVGAPLGHDFCAISLSDLLTPWNIIEQRIAAAASGDFVVAFYNPVSRRRTTQLEIARTILLEHRTADTPVVLAANIARPTERIRITTLGDLKVEDVDMLTTVVVGSSMTRVMKRGDGTHAVYTPRGYAAKATSRLKSERVLA